jgi:hypothetical protein
LSFFFSLTSARTWRLSLLMAPLSSFSVCIPTYAHEVKESVWRINCNSIQVIWKREIDELTVVQSSSVALEEWFLELVACIFL